MSDFDNVPAEIAQQVLRVSLALVEERARWVLANPPVRPGFHRHVRRETRQWCACTGSSVLTTIVPGTPLWDIRECPCTRWVSRDYPDGQCPPIQYLEVAAP